MFKDWKEFEFNHYAVATTTILAVISPGFLCLLHFKPELVETLDTVKLLVASISLTLPLAIINFVIIAFLTRHDDNFTHDVEWSFSSFVSALVLYLSLYLAYLFVLPFSQFTFSVIVFDIIAVVFIYILFTLEDRKDS